MKKLINTYIENELAESQEYNEDSPFLTSKIFEVYNSENPKFIDITNHTFLPSQFSVLQNNENLFLEEDLSEISMQEHIEEVKKKYINLPINREKEMDIKIVACFANNVLQEFLIFDLSIPTLERHYAVIMSEPRFEILEIND
jgi:hypothetical protein